MGSYRNDDEALIGLARQLTDAYGEARTREDQDYACDSIAEYLSEFRDAAPSEALLAILDLPLTAETYPLVDEAQVALAARGPGVVELLLEAVLGDVYDPDGPAPERAAETLDLDGPARGLARPVRGAVRPRRRPAQGRRRGRRWSRSAGVAEPDLVVTLDDPVGGEWARAALEQLRFEREHPGRRRRRVEPDDADDEEPATPRTTPADGADDADGRPVTATTASRPPTTASRRPPATPPGLPAGPPARPGARRRRLRRLPPPVRAGAGRGAASS